MVRDAAKRDAARQDFNRLREQLRDPLLTVLTIVLAFWMFVLAPLHESAARDTNIVGFLLALAVAAALLVLSGRAVSALLMLFGITMSAAAAWFRLHDPSPLDILLNAGAWIIIGLVLIWVVGHAVFAPGRITFHRIMGAILRSRQSVRLAPMSACRRKHQPSPRPSSHWATPQASSARTIWAT
jgi:uncharacterized membrane protein